jgi:hypothetical protein
MAVQVITLKTGDRIVTELKEAFEGDGEDKKGICLIMEHPYVLSIVGDIPQYLTEEVNAEYTVKFSKWNPYSSDYMFKIPYDCVMTISSPDPNLAESYNKKIEQTKEIQNDGSN